MNKFKKIFLCSLVLCHNMTMASDDRISNAIVAGLITTGAVIFGGVAWKATSDYSKKIKIEQIKRDEKTRIEREKEEELNLENKARVAIISAKKLVAEKSKYGEIFDLKNNQIETTLESILSKYGKNKSHKQESIKILIKQDVQDLQMLKNILSQPCFAQNVKIAQSLSSISFLLENALNLLSAVEKHHIFFDVQQKLIFYINIPKIDTEVINWIYSKSNSALHPLSNFVDNAENYLEFTEIADLSLYPTLAKKALELRKTLKKSVIFLHKTGKIQIEATEKHNIAIKEAQLKAAQEKNQIEKTGADAQRRRAQAQEELVQNQRHANDLERKKIEEIQKSNTLLALRYPIDQENNRLQAEKNRLQAEKNRVTAEHNRLQSERARIDALHAENRRRDIAAMEVENRLLAERNQLERNRQAAQKPAPHNHQNPEPSAPPTPPTRDNDDNIPVARPYMGTQPPQATAQYRNQK